MQPCRSFAPLAGWTIRLEDFDPSRGTGTGFKFRDYNAGALLEKYAKPFTFMASPRQWRKIQLNGMARDNSWSAAAQKYVQLYREIIDLT